MHVFWCAWCETYFWKLWCSTWPVLRSGTPCLACLKAMAGCAREIEAERNAILGLDVTPNRR